MSLDVRCRKVKFTRGEAEFAVLAIRKAGTDTRPDALLRPYLCTRCEAWHVGHDMVPGDESSQ